MNTDPQLKTTIVNTVKNSGISDYVTMVGAEVTEILQDKLQFPVIVICWLGNAGPWTWDSYYE